MKNKNTIIYSLLVFIVVLITFFIIDSHNSRKQYMSLLSDTAYVMTGTTFSRLTEAQQWTQYQAFMAQIFVAHSDGNMSAYQKIIFIQKNWEYWQMCKDRIPSPFWAVSSAIVETSLSPSLVGRFGEVGLFQMMPSTVRLIQGLTLPNSMKVLTDTIYDSSQVSDPTIALQLYYRAMWYFMGKYNDSYWSTMAWHWGDALIDKYYNVGATKETFEHTLSDGSILKRQASAYYYIWCGYVTAFENFDLQPKQEIKESLTRYREVRESEYNLTQTKRLLKNLTADIELRDAYIQQLQEQDSALLSRLQIVSSKINSSLDIMASSGYMETNYKQAYVDGKEAVAELLGSLNEIKRIQRQLVVPTAIERQQQFKSKHPRFFFALMVIICVTWCCQFLYIIFKLIRKKDKVELY